MGGGDLNMKKSWHPVLLVNQERVWKAEKKSNEEKKALNQLKKEREEERQLAELQRMQEERTGRKRVERLDWMYSSSGNEGGALGGARISETMMEDYLLGKRRVDEVLSQADKNVGNTHKDFVAVQNANTARDTAAKIREDPLLAIKRQEEAALKAMANRPDIRRQMKAMQQGKVEETKEERKARKRAEKEDRRKERHEKREKRRGDDRYSSPRSDYPDERDIKPRRDSYRRDERDERDRKRYRSDSRSVSPRRRDDSPRRHRDERDDRDKHSRRYRDDSPRRRDDSPRLGDRPDDDRDRDHRSRRSGSGRDDRVPPPRDYSNGRHNGHSNDRANGHSNGHHNVHSNGHSNGHGHGNGYGNGNSGHSRPYPNRPTAADMADRPISRPPPPPADKPNSSSLDDLRAARLAAMSQNAVNHDSQRSKLLAELEEKRKREDEAEQKMRAKEGAKENASAAFYQQQSSMSLGESLSRRGGQGLQRNI